MIHYFRSILVAMIFTLANCDTKKEPLPQGFLEQFLCFSGAICEHQKGTRFAMIGDSWSDLVFGQPAIEALRLQLERYYGYRITGATRGGETLVNVATGQTYQRVIDQAGPDVRYMLLSLGGNDLQFAAERYVGNFETEKSQRFDSLQHYLLDMIRKGNTYKVQKWGGAPLLWIIHGYDYTNPDVPSIEGSISCRPRLLTQGFSEAEVSTFGVKLLNDFNDRLQQITHMEPQLRYINLRGTLGEAVAKQEYMYDCIHPNSIGFKLLAEKYVQWLEGYTSYER